MDAPTTQVTVDRESAEVMLGATRAWKTLATEMPGLFAPGEALKLASAELLLVAALDRISYLESKPENVKPVLRTKLAAHLAFPAGVKAW
jgi:hypothetical protein